jgi:hypothetical protein
LAGGGHQRYVEDPSALTHQATVADGNAILGHILGSKDASRALADGDLLSMLTPMLDRDGDGSPINDILGSVGKIFGGR